MDAVIVCRYCTHTEKVSANFLRIDQLVYGKVWEHVAAAHYKEAAPIRAMSVAERKAHLLGWSDLPMKDPPDS